MTGRSSPRPLGQHPKTVKLWEVATGKERTTLEGGSVAVAFSPDGKLLALATTGRAVQQWVMPAAEKSDK